MTFSAALVPIIVGCAAVHDDAPAFVGSNGAVALAAEAARQCGVRRLRIGGPLTACPSCSRPEATLYLPRAPERPAEGKAQLCLFRWSRGRPDLDMVIIVD